jgi:hypothetical protein
VDWKGCDRKLSRLIWSSIYIRRYDWGWCHEIIWRDTWRGTHDRGCCLVKLKVLYGLDSMWKEVWRPIWSNIWIRTDDTGWCLDLILSGFWMEKLGMYAVVT